MSALFRPGLPDASVQVGEYQEFPQRPAEVAAAPTAPPKAICGAACGGVRLLLLTLGLACLLQAALNVSLRLTLTPPTCAEVEVESDPEAEAEVAVEVEKEAEKGAGTTQPQEALGCPPGWLLFAARCYFVSPRRSSWDESRQDCRGRGSDLVVIETRVEQAFLTGFAAAAWVGMTDRRREGSWVWVDGTPVDRQRQRWALGQPDGAYGGEDCGDLRTMSRFIGLNDYSCSAREQWICERAATPANRSQRAL